MTDVTDVVSVVTESVLPSGGTVLGGEPGQRRCKRPGCGNLVPVSGRGRARVFCGDACSRRFHNAARSAGGDAGAVSPGQAADPLGALEALIRQAGAVVTLARGQVAALDPEVVAAQLAEAEAARRRAEARAVTAEARAAEAEQEMLAALEAAQAAHRGQEAAEAEARRAREETAQARRELAEEVARARADAEAALARAGRLAAEAAGIAETARTERDQAGEQAAAAVRAAEAELARARQGETDAREQARQAREDAAREREALDGQYQARLEAAGQLAAAERDRALRAEQRLDAERERHDGLLAVLTAAGGTRTQPAAGGPGWVWRPGVLVPAARPGTRHERREGARGAHHVAARAAPPLIPGRRNLPPGGQHARKFASSQVTLMIRKEGTYVRAMTIAPARQLTLDIPWPGRDETATAAGYGTRCPTRPGPGCCACSRP